MTQHEPECSNGSAAAGRDKQAEPQDLAALVVLRLTGDLSIWFIQLCFVFDWVGPAADGH